MPRLPDHPLTGQALRAAARSLRLPAIGAPLRSIAAWGMDLDELRKATIPADAVPWRPPTTPTGTPVERSS